jgi:hypothetical protein
MRLRDSVLDRGLWVQQRCGYSTLCLLHCTVRGHWEGSNLPPHSSLFRTPHIPLPCLLLHACCAEEMENPSFFSPAFCRSRFLLWPTPHPPTRTLSPPTG